MMADHAFWPAIAFMAGCSLCFRARIKSDRVAMQWGFDGKPTWSAPKAIGLWGTVVLVLFTRSLIWGRDELFPAKRSWRGIWPADGVYCFRRVAFDRARSRRTGKSDDMKSKNLRV
jgi:hypothetical protein